MFIVALMLFLLVIGALLDVVSTAIVLLLVLILFFATIGVLFGIGVSCFFSSGFGSFVVVFPTVV
jgi:hypothetical protein